MQGNKLFKVNLQGTLLAMDAQSGAVLWQATLDDYKKGYSATAAPLVVKNLVVTGMAGAEFGTRGFIDAYDVEYRQARLAFLYRRGRRRARRRNLGGRFLEARRRLHLGHRHLRSRAESDLLGHRQSRSGSERRGAAAATIYTPAAWSRSTPTPENSSGITSSRLTIVHDWDAIGDPVPVDLTREWQHGQGAHASQSQRLLLRARSHQRQAAAHESVHQSHLGRRHRRRTAARS